MVYMMKVRDDGTEDEMQRIDRAMMEQNLACEGTEHAMMEQNLACERT